MRETKVKDTGGTDYRIGISARRRGKSEKFGDYFKTEDFKDRQELHDEIDRFLDDTFEYDDSQIFENGEDEGDYEN